MAHGSEHTRQSQTQMAAKHLRPFIGHLPLRSVTPGEAGAPVRRVAAVPRALPATTRSGACMPAAAPDDGAQAALRVECGVSAGGALGLDRPQPHPRRRTTRTTASPAAATHSQPRPRRSSARHGSTQTWARSSGWPWPPELGGVSYVRCGGGTWTSRRMCWWYRRGSRRPTGRCGRPTPSCINVVTSPWIQSPSPFSPTITRPDTSAPPQSVSRCRPTGTCSHLVPMDGHRGRRRR